MKRLGLCLFCLFFLVHLSSGQMKVVLIGIDGLHCSACSFSTEKALRQLDFVGDVKMDLNKHVAAVTIKTGHVADFTAMAHKVVDAGFSVGSLSLLWDFKQLDVFSGLCFDAGGMGFSFIGIKDKPVLDGPQVIHLVGRDFMARAEFKKWKLLMNNACTPAAMPGGPLAKVYFVTL
jgi:copper chaperone CopZ